MYTQCPHCLTVFQIEEDALQSSLGIVQCGHCARRFDALRTLSHTLPRVPNTPPAEDPAKRVPTLTEAVPPNAFPPPPLTPPAPGSGSDWFADFETELTTSLIADSAQTATGDGSGDYAWQVTDLAVQGLASSPEPPVVLGDFRLHDEELADQAAWCESLEDAGLLLGGAPKTVAAEFPAPGGGEGIEPPSPEDAATEPDEPTGVPGDEAGPSPPDGLDLAAGDPQGMLPPESVPVGVAHRDALPASLFLVHEADQEAAATPDAREPEAPDAAASEASPHQEVVSDPAEPLPPVYVRPRRHRTAGMAWTLGCLVLVVVLAAQVAWIKRVELFRSPATHAWTARACEVIACRLPPMRDVAKLELMSRDVRPDPRVAGALTITATLRNDAGFRQPWPVVVVKLSDLDNNPVAMRRFRPAEYMPDPDRRAGGIAPGATSAIAFEVADPGRRAVSFEFGFE